MALWTGGTNEDPLLISNVGPLLGGTNDGLSADVDTFVPRLPPTTSTCTSPIGGGMALWTGGTNEDPLVISNLGIVLGGTNDGLFPICNVGTALGGC